MGGKWQLLGASNLLIVDLDGVYTNVFTLKIPFGMICALFSIYLILINKFIKPMKV